MAKYDTHREIFYCDCGHQMHRSFYSDLSDELDKFDNEIEESETIVCNSCKRVFELTLRLEMEIAVNKNKVELKSYIYQDKDNNEFASCLLNDATIGDAFNLDDGQYLSTNKIYYIENSHVIHIFTSDIDKNQLSFFTEGTPRKEFEYNINGYGRTTDMYHLPIGTKFRVINGAWNGEIIEIDSKKHILIENSHRTIELNPWDDYCLSIDKRD